MKPSVYACITTRDGNIRNDVMSCLVGSVGRAQASGVSVIAGRQQFSHGTAICRNKAVADYLAHTKASHLLFVDDDVLLPPESIMHLADCATRPGRDIACGAYPTLKFTTPSKAYLYLTARPVGADWLEEWPSGDVEIDAGGTGCMLIRREVFAAVGFPWFRWPEQHDPETGTVQWVSDDVDFCAAARNKGFRVWCDGRVRPGHLKLTDLRSLIDGSLAWRSGGQPDPTDGYGSHREVLKTIARNTPVRFAVEYGSGRFSTPLFLNREAFPDLEKLWSIESNSDWYEDTKRHCGSDSRLMLNLVPIEKVQEASHPPADLVFIDCDVMRNGQHDFSPRVKLLERYAPRATGVVVIHDANFASIKPAVEAAPYRYKYVYHPTMGPDTAVLSNEVDVARWFGGKS